MRVVGVFLYPSFSEMLNAHGLSAVLPDAVTTVPDGVRLYHSFQTRHGESYAEMEQQHGVVAIEVERL